MSKQYLIDEESLLSAQKTIGNLIDAKEVEVLDEQDLYGIEDDYFNFSNLDFPDYLNANHLIIVKIKE